MTLYRAMTILQGESNLPEDRFVNTWHFSRPDSIGKVTADMDLIAARLIEFFEDDVAPTNRSVVSYIPASVITNALEIRIYDLAEAEPRQPTMYDAAVTPGATVALPTEVACCVSYYAERNIPGQRGRVYIGPLSTETGVDTDLGRGLRPADAFVNTLNAAAGRLAAYNIVGANLVDWVVYSRRAGDAGGARPITGGWVDNAYDTQRRRGTAPTTRALFGDAAP